MGLAGFRLQHESFFLEFFLDPLRLFPDNAATRLVGLVPLAQGRAMSFLRALWIFCLAFKRSLSAVQRIPRVAHRRRDVNLLIDCQLQPPDAVIVFVDVFFFVPIAAWRVHVRLFHLDHNFRFFLHILCAFSTSSFPGSAGAGAGFAGTGEDLGGGIGAGGGAGAGAGAGCGLACAQACGDTPRAKAIASTKKDIGLLMLRARLWFAAPIVSPRKGITRHDITPNRGQSGQGWPRHRFACCASHGNHA